MKLQRFFSVIVLCAFIFISSCKKDSDPPVYNVEYKINTQDLDAFVNISYVDSTGAQVNGLIPGATSFLRTTTVKTTPFTASIGVKVISETTHQIDYDLVISVNGVIKKIVNGITPPFSSSTTKADFVIN